MCGVSLGCQTCPLAWLEASPHSLCSSVVYVGDSIVVFYLWLFFSLFFVFFLTFKSID
jgi:hypothetical protein